jgi:hypothetical protein
MMRPMMTGSSTPTPYGIPWFKCRPQREAPGNDERQPGPVRSRPEEEAIQGQ